MQGACGIGGNADILHYVWQPLIGDGNLSARVTGVTTSSEYEQADAGVMLLASSGPVAPYYFVYSGNVGSVEVGYRAGQGHAAQHLADLRLHLVPVYLGVGRAGDTHTAYVFDDGATWAPLNESSVALPAMGSTLETGLAVASFQTGWLSMATFDHVFLGL